MAKRFTDTNKWDKEWFMALPPKQKCLWMYINDKCDQAGMWESNFKLATIFIGEEVCEADLTAFGDRIEKFAPGKIWIVGHIDFQSGQLSEKSPAHKPIFKLLSKYTLLDRVLNRVYNTLQEKEKETEKEKEKDNGGTGEILQPVTNTAKTAVLDTDMPTLEQWKSYAQERLRGRYNDLEFAVELKYHELKNNDWKDFYQRAILPQNWKAALVREIPHLKKINPGNGGEQMDTKKVTINSEMNGKQSGVIKFS